MNTLTQKREVAAKVIEALRPLDNESKFLVLTAIISSMGTLGRTTDQKLTFIETVRDTMMMFIFSGAEHDAETNQEDLNWPIHLKR